MSLRKTLFISLYFVSYLSSAYHVHRHETIGNDSLAGFFIKQADTLMLYNRHDSSISYLNRALKLYQEKNDWHGIIKCQNKISENLGAQFRLKESLELSQKTIELASTKLGQNHLETAAAINNLGNVFYLTGQHEKALEEFQKALEIHELPENQDHLYSAPTNLGIGNVYYNKNRYGEAFKYFKNALETNKKILGENHPYVANSYLSLGNLYRNKGSYNLASEYYEKALEINRHAFGENHPDVATTYIGMADIFKSSGQYEIAMQYYRQAELIYKGFLNPINPKFGAIYLGFADVHKNRGNYKEAVNYYQKTKELFVQTIGENHQSYIQANLGIGNTYMYQEKFREALDFYNRVLDINFNLVGEAHVNTSAAYNNLGSIYYFFGDFELAIRYFKKALEIDLEIHGKEHPNVANAYYNLGRVYGERGETDVALINVQEAINASIIDFNDQNVYVNPVLVNFFDNKDLLWFLSFKGELLESGFTGSANMKGLDIALNSFVLSDSLVEQIRQSYTDRRDQVELAHFSSKIYKSAVNACYSLITMLNQQNVKQISREATYEAKLKEYKDWFFYFTEKNKAAILFSSLAESNAKSFGGIPDTLLDRETELKNLINQYTQELAANPDSSMQAYYQKQLFKVNREYEDLIFQLENDFPKYYDLKYDISVVGINDLQQMLDPGTMVMSYYVLEDKVYIQYISKTGLKVELVEKHDQYEKLVKGMRAGLLYKSRRIYTKNARALYKQYFPSGIPEGIENIVVVLDGIMATVPFEALLTDDIADSLEYADFPYLINDAGISYTYSANLLYKTFKNAKILRPKAKLDGIAAAPVNFDLSNLHAFRDARKEAAKETNSKYAYSIGVSIAPEEMKPLPGTKVEVETIDSILQANNRSGQMLIYQDANETNIKQGILSKYKFVHIASHGFVNQQEPEFSGIFLAQDTTPDQDNILFSGELYNINLNAELVTLSACETGLGKISTGEGIIGLTRALLYAGAKNVTVSLWKVSDASTKDLMINYYGDFLKKKTPKAIDQSIAFSTSLRSAKMALIKSDYFSHPYYWSPFVLIGK